MTRLSALSALFLAAILEAGGDAVVRAGNHRGRGVMRLLLLLAGAAILFAYGVTVNTLPWDFGRLLGIYVVFFFLVAQAISWFAFSRPPSPTTIVGGAFILLGGII